MAKKKDETIESETVNTPVTEASDNYVAKLSVKALGCDPRLGKGETRQVLCRIYGKAQGLKHGEDVSRGSVWTALQGTFEGINCQETSDDYGKTLRSGKLFLPGGIQDVIEGAILEIQKSASAETASVTFGVELSSVKASNPIGYSYEARNLVERTTRDEMAELRKAIETKAGKLKALPAPKPAV